MSTMEETAAALDLAALGGMLATAATEHWNSEVSLIGPAAAAPAPAVRVDAMALIDGQPLGRLVAGAGPGIDAQALRGWLEAAATALGGLLAANITVGPAQAGALAGGLWLAFSVERAPAAGRQGPTPAWLGLDAQVLSHCQAALRPGAGGSPFPPLDPIPTDTAGAVRNLDVLLDVQLRVSVELGRTVRQVRDVLALVPGSVLDLDRLAGDPLDILVNGRRIARGEVVVVDERFAVRVTEICSAAERVERLG